MSEAFYISIICFTGILLLLAIIYIIYTYFQNRDYNIMITTQNHKLKNENEELTTENFKLTNELKTLSPKIPDVRKSEEHFIKVLEKNFGDKYKIKSQVLVSSIIDKNKMPSYMISNEYYTHPIDIGIFNKQTHEGLVMIEINTKEHDSEEQKKKDKKVKDICTKAGYKFITFWTKYSNTEKYICQRVQQELNQLKEHF